MADPHRYILNNLLGGKSYEEFIPKFDNALLTSGWKDMQEGDVLGLKLNPGDFGLSQFLDSLGPKFEVESERPLDDGKVEVVVKITPPVRVGLHTTKYRFVVDPAGPPIPAFEVIQTHPLFRGYMTGEFVMRISFLPQSTKPHVEFLELSDKARSTSTTQTSTSDLESNPQP